ncbi:MAG: AraC family transcriptional regulator [Oscillospiraceae bacterium]|nr:AraC family transcriptional regulator [Oscillospiraceae bacterium]
MKGEIRQVSYDRELGIEACFFEGISQPFPPHFHEYYVVGFIESGRRRLSVCGKEFTAETGDILLFNPRDNHFCRGLDGNTLTYGAFNIKSEAMEKLASKTAGIREPLRFSENLVRDGDLFLSVKRLHEAVMRPQENILCCHNFTGKANSLPRREKVSATALHEKEELFLLTFSRLIAEYSERSENEARAVPERRVETEKACLYMQENFSEHISLDKLCRLTALSRAALVRSFAKEKGISPYRYLENIRLEAARRFLEQGEAPVEAALKTGFSDQSHFTNFFRSYIGLTPKQYGNIFKTR